MSDGDTQWPRFEVFQQVLPDTPFHNVGSVHAPDAEMALQNARDVFVRRPQTVTLWVAPASEILMKTREELAREPNWMPETVIEGVADQRYYLFSKTSQRRAMTFVVQSGELTARTPLHALRKAIELDSGDDVYVWWIVPVAAVTSSKPDEVDSLFAPAHDKEFRLPSAYHTRTLMDQLRQGEAENDDGI